MLMVPVRGSEVSEEIKSVLLSTSENLKVESELFLFLIRAQTMTLRTGWSRGLRWQATSYWRILNLEVSVLRMIPQLCIIDIFSA